MWSFPIRYTSLVTVRGLVSVRSAPNRPVPPLAKRVLTLVKLSMVSKRVFSRMFVSVWLITSLLSMYTVNGMSVSFSWLVRSMSNV